MFEVCLGESYRWKNWMRSYDNSACLTWLSFADGASTDDEIQKILTGEKFPPPPRPRKSYDP